MTTIQGRVWLFGDGIDTDLIIPARHLVLPLDEMKHMAMEPIQPGFAGNVGAGDMIVAGTNFGCGSSREQAPAVLKALGISAIVAESFARIFFRNAINLGIPVIECPGISGQVRNGDTIEVDPQLGTVRVVGTDRKFTGTRLPDFLLQIIADGGLIPHLSARKSP
jgi:3-isopropylmalate/(R)-2-methylmalate dehydratase small subunit